MSVLLVVTRPSRTLRWRSLTVDQDRMTVRVSGAELPMSPGDFRLVELLITNRDQPLSKAAILDALFGPGHGRDPRQADMFVARLRRIFVAAGVGDVISTVAGRGYAILDSDGGIDLASVLHPRSGEVLLAA